MTYDYTLSACIRYSEWQTAQPIQCRLLQERLCTDDVELSGVVLCS